MTNILYHYTYVAIYHIVQTMEEFTFKAYISKYMAMYR